MVRQGQPVPNGSLVSERLNVLLVQNYCDEYHHCAILVYYPFPPAPPPAHTYFQSAEWGRKEDTNRDFPKGTSRLTQT